MLIASMQKSFIFKHGLKLLTESSGFAHRGYAVVRLSPVIEAVGVTSITPHPTPVMLVTPTASITWLKPTTA